MRGITELNKLLKIFNQELGEYLNFIGDKSKTYPALSGSVKINDFDNGSVSNIIEYTMQLANYFIEQMDVRYTAGEILDYILQSFYGITREPLESDTDYYNRAKDLIFDAEISPLAILNAVADYCDDAEIVLGTGEGAFADVSFIGNYTEFHLEGEDVVTPSYLEIQGGKHYFFRLIMENVHPKNYRKIIELVNEYKAGGIDYEIELDEYYNIPVGFTDVSFLEYDSEIAASPPDHVVTASFTGT
jgi:hypothetical protein